MSEPFLLRVEPCACGGTIIATAWADDILHAVQLHNASREHATWRRRREKVQAAYWLRRSIVRDVGYIRTLRAVREIDAERAA